jgi:tetratricopeptide (TPR) repeat protein
MRRSLRVLAVGMTMALGTPAWSVAETSTDYAVAVARRQIQRRPFDATGYHRLGDAYVRKARETGDAAYWQRAEQALVRALELAPDLAGAARHLAYVFYSRHEFGQAVDQAKRAIALDPEDGHALGILGDAQLETGDYAGAEATYARMMARGADLYALSRRAGLRVIRGDPGGAIADLTAAIAEGQASGLPREAIAWVQWQLGTEQASLGRLREAEAAFEASLVTYPGYFRALAGLASVRAAQRRDREAAALYRQALAVVPLPEYAAALGDVLTRAGDTEDAQRQYALVEHIGRLSALNRQLYNRELAVFYTDHDVKVAEALALAEEELRVRRDVYAWDLLAWALHRNGRHREARHAMRRALAEGTQDARLFFHAGLIETALGDPAAARAFLERALAINPHFHVSHADEAARVLGRLRTERGPDGSAGALAHEGAGVDVH